MTLPAALLDLIEAAKGDAGPVVFLTGAGVSAESGIPTFRGEEGYWTVGSRHYRPTELATWSAYSEMPWDVWAWYLYRRSVCRAADPNDGHRALAKYERSVGDRCLVITQNVDGLHLRAGSTLDRTYQIHGNIDYMRCSRECSADWYLIPDGVSVEWDKGRSVTVEEQAALQCPKCGERSRPHVLWFDETYDEPKFRFDSSLEAAQRASLLFVVGTSGATTLPHHVANIVARRGAPFVAINLDPSPFTEMAESQPRGFFLQSSAKDAVVAIVDALA